MFLRPHYSLSTVFLALSHRRSLHGFLTSSNFQHQQKKPPLNNQERLFPFPLLQGFDCLDNRGGVNLCHVQQLGKLAGTGPCARLPA